VQLTANQVRQTTGTTGVYTVTDTISHIDPVLVALTLDAEALETTPEHPFFVLLRGWVEADDLQRGDQVRQADGAYGVVSDIAFVARTQPIYNLTVAQAHTFFVGDGRWLVHNCGGQYIGPERQLTARTYPSITDPRTGKPIPFPEGNLVPVDATQRVSWGKQERAAYIREWYDKGYPSPPHPWDEYDIHHIKPRAFGGTNQFDNLVPLLHNPHEEFNTFWRPWERRR
jgi:hypothetical protein